MDDSEITGIDSSEPSTGGQSESARDRNFVEQKIDSFSVPVENMKKQADTVMNNPDISASNKAVAVGLSVIEAGTAVNGAINAIKGLSTELADKALVAVLGKLKFLHGIACLPVVKQMDPVTGIDIHFVVIPPSPAVPMPHPYIGIMFEPRDFVSCTLLSVAAMFTPPPPPAISPDSDNAAATAANIAKAQSTAYRAVTGKLRNTGASVKIGSYIPRVVAGTRSKPVPHISMGAGFSPAFAMVRKTCGYAYLGSLFVNADGNPLTGGYAHLHNDCWDVGKPPVEKMLAEAFARMFRMPPSPPPPSPPMVELYLPTGIMMPIPWNRPVLVNPVPTPINPTQVANIFLKAGFAKFMSKSGLDRKVNALKQKARDKGEKLIKKLENTKLGKKLGCSFWSKQSAKFGTNTSHPADVSAGHFFTRGTDFSVSGIIPLEFRRIYNSYSDFNSSLGKGWSHCYGIALALDTEAGFAGVRLEDGRTAGFHIPAQGKSSYNRKEKLWLHRNGTDCYHLGDKKGLVYRFTEREYRNRFNKSETHLLQSISNRNGYSIRFAYDGDGILEKITDTAGHVFTVENDGNGHISKIISPSAETGGKPFVISSYGYDGDGRMIKQTDAEGYSMEFEYGGTLMTQEKWRNGLKWHISYGKRGTDAKVLEIRGDGGIYHHKLDYVSANCTVVTDSLGHRTTYYHRNGLVTKRIDPNGGETVFRNNDNCELEWTRDPLGNVSSASFDGLGNMTDKTSADGGFVSMEYENTDFPYLPTSAIDKAGGRWKWKYDAQGNLQKRTNPLGAETLFEYSDGLLTAITGAKGEKTKLEYDSEFNLVKTVSPDGGINRWDYDCLGHCTRHENAKNGVTEYKYNALGDAVRVKLPDGNVREIEYDAQGNVIHAKDATRDVRFTYRGVNKLASRTEGFATLRFAYDTEDRLRFVENETGERYEFRLDEQGEVTEETGFDGLKRRYCRDLAGRVESVIRPNGDETAYEYDETGRVTKVTYNPGDEKKREEETYEYRKDGLLVKAVNAGAEVILERDILGRVIKETCNGNEVKSEYDISGNRIHISSNLGADIEAEYNLMGDVVSLANGGWQTKYERDIFGLETGRAFDGGVRTKTDRDTLGRVTGHRTEKNNCCLTEKLYLWGANDRLLSTVTDGKTKTFSYDMWGNLSKTVFEDGTAELRNPDRTGNLFETPQREDRKYAKGGQLVKTPNWEYKYDREGNLVRKKDRHGQTWRYGWNAAGMLVYVKRPDAHEVFFKYDALGRRIEKKFGNVKTRWVWDGNVPLHEQRSSYERAWDAEKREICYPETKQPLVTWIFEEGTFVPAAKISDGQKLSILTNYMGTPEAMYREDGQAVWTCELNSYGKVRDFKGQSKTMCPFRYQGQYEDAETGLYYNRFRYYSPEEGMYISQDPIRLLGGVKSYGYVHDSNSWLDVLGLFSFFRGAKGNASPTFKPNSPVYNTKGKQIGGEYKIDKTTGLVQPTHGVSVFNNPESVISIGLTPHEVDSSTVSDKLKIQQRASDPNHFEIMPKEPMTEDEYKAELSKIKCKN